MKTTINKTLEKILVALLAIMLISVVWQVFSRYVLKAPSTITDEVSSFSLIWTGLLGAAYATGQKLHLAIDLIPEHAVAKNRSVYEGIVHFSVFFFAFCVMIIGGIRLCWLSFVFEQTSATLEIPMWIVYTVVPLSGILICYYSINALLEIRNLKNPSL